MITEAAYTRAEAFICELRRWQHQLTTQQLRTLKGQALAGDIEGAKKGLHRLLLEKGRVTA